MLTLSSQKKNVSLNWGHLKSYLSTSDKILLVPKLPKEPSFKRSWLPNGFREKCDLVQLGNHSVHFHFWPLLAYKIESAWGKRKDSELWKTAFWQRTHSIPGGSHYLCISNVKLIAFIISTQESTELTCNSCLTYSHLQIPAKSKQKIK